MEGALSTDLNQSNRNGKLWVIGGLCQAWELHGKLAYCCLQTYTENRKKEISQIQLRV